MKNKIDSYFAIAILALVVACVGFSFWFLHASEEMAQEGASYRPLNVFSKKAKSKSTREIVVKDLEGFSCDTPQIPLQTATDALCFQVEAGLLDLAKNNSFKSDNSDINIDEIKWKAKALKSEEGWLVRITSDGPYLPRYECEVVTDSSGKNTSVLTVIPCGYNK